MRVSIRSVVIVTIAMGLACSSSATETEDPGWPQEVSNDNGKMIVYQPQIDKWDDYLHLEARVAVAVTKAGSDTPILGAIRLAAETQTDHESRTVLIFDKKIIDARYPALDSAKWEEMTNIVQSLIEPNPQLYALDRILANLEQTTMTVRTTPVNVEPPMIFTSSVPAILIQFDGDPIFGPIKDTELKFAVNTNWDLILDPDDSTYYLLNDKSWLQTSSLDVPFVPAGELPASFSRIPKTEEWTTVKVNTPGVKLDSADIPKIFIAMKPAELIVTDGEVKTEQIEKTKISWVTNTESDLFFNNSENKYYFLVSGRWFVAQTLEAAWSSAGNNLPEDFALIPEDHEKAHVLVSVPGTPQADEAVMQAQIPQQASVNRDSVSLEVTYEGEPEFKPIESTELLYAVNTPFTVIMSGSSYYACHDAVWFVSVSANGPWVVCADIPAPIYAIPPSSPVHHVTYVYVYESSPTVVVYGYTSGYHGIYVSFGCVVFGTGYYYPPYVYWGPHHHPIYYPHHHHSYGVAAYYNPYRGTYVRGAAVYGPHGGYGRAAAYNPHTGTYARGASAWGPHGGTTVASAHNPYTGGRASTRQSYNSYSQWGETVVSRGDKWAHTAHYSDSRGTVAGWETSEGGRGVIVDDGNQRGLIAKDRNDDLYAGKDGELYKRGEDGWTKYDNGDWNNVERPDNNRQTTGDRSDRVATTQPVDRSTQTKDRANKSQVTRDQSQKNKQKQKSSWSNRSRTRDLDRSASARSRGNKRVSSYKSNRSRSSSRSRGRSGGRRR